MSQVSFRGSTLPMSNYCQFRFFSMRQVSFRGSMLPQSNYCRFRFSLVSSWSSSPAKINSSVGNEIASKLSHAAGTGSIPSCDGETQADNQTPKKKSLANNPNDCSLPVGFGKRKKSPEFRRKSALADSVHFKGRKWYSDCSPITKDHSVPMETFDICGGYSNRRSIKEEDGFTMDAVPTHELSGYEEGLVLRPGLVLLKGFLTHDDQVSIVKECRALGLGPGGFYRPGYKFGAKLRLQMMCLGLDWDPQTKKYSKQRAIDKSRPQGIPREFRSSVEKAIRYSQDVVAREYDTDNVEDILPMMSTDICIVNFYTIAGRLGLHQDRDETRGSIAKGLPVVSFSIGDAAEFLYCKERRVDKAEKVILESGDVLIFGGVSRLLFHGVESIIPGSAPKALIEETGLRPGRLNLTFRQY